jgi:hypothetical protein
VYLVPAPLYGPPQCDSDRQHKIVMLAGARLIRRPASGGQVAAKIFQLLVQRVRLAKFSGEA